MKEVFSIFGNEIFRPLTTLFLPGVISISSWFIGAIQRHPSFASIVGRNHTETAFVLVLASVFCGLIIEDVGSRVEAKVFDKKRNKDTDGQHERDWFAYLRLVHETEPIGRRYIRTLVLRLKFELGSRCSSVRLDCFTP